ncbi:MAG: stage III sporulation protein AE [Defluviitaleaceae bacterium]|nr:stage III sporulation protein AE [Defluviitaleaceae bacterium]
MTNAPNHALDIADIIPFDNFDLHLLDRPGLPRFRDLVQQAIRGELDLSLGGILDSGVQIIFGEFMTSTGLLRQLLIIAILSALLSCLTEAFSHKSAGELGFYVTFLMTALLAISSFYVSVEILNGVVSLVSGIMLASIPLMTSIMIMSGNVVGAASFNPLLFFALQLITWFVSVVYVPLILASAGLDLVNHLSETVRLDKLAELLRKIADWALKGITGIFALLLTLQRFSAPIASNVAIRTTHTALGAIPVVGNALNAAVDTVIHFGQAARSGVLVALVLVLCIAMATPLLKLAVLAGMYKVTAGLVQPVADKRLVKCMDIAAKHMGQLFRAGAIVGVMCIYTVVILLSF